ncbi:hypothetical protein [Luteolibacter soli]|uniref:Uncharacterized protein n=1 Tax=Luteolibacter soli TaxID=3135280 RepID=A0ABU9ASK1_9BACT
MKNAARFAFALALAVASLGWLPQETGKRKMRMAAAPVAPTMTAQVA